MKVSLSELAKRIRECDAGFFSVTFVKRTTGETRTMTCRKGVTKHLKGGELKYNPEDLGLISVYSMDAKGYRSIPVEGLISAKIDGEEYSI